MIMLAFTLMCFGAVLLATTNAQVCYAEGKALMYLFGKGKIDYPLQPTCDANGNYAPIHCQGSWDGGLCTNNGDYADIYGWGSWCYCVSGKKGQTLMGYVVPISKRAYMENTFCSCAIGNSGSISKWNHCMPNGGPYTKCINHIRKFILQQGRNGWRTVDQAIVQMGGQLYCDDQGVFRAKQCSSGKCMCVGPNMEKLVNYGPARDIDDPTRDCLCARKEFVTGKKLNCLPNGNFRKVITKAPIPTPATLPPTIPPTQAPTPPPITLPPRPESLCEKRYKRNPNDQKCASDGSFAAVQCIAKECYCVEKKAGKRLGFYSFEKDSVDHRWANCQCARDEATYEGNGEPLTVTCLRNGNYESCSMKLYHYRGDDLKGLDKPECNCVGRFRARQCDDRSCYCASGYGHRIGKYSVPYSLKDKMSNCTCAREEDSLKLRGVLGTMILPCDDYGDYQKLRY